MPYPDLDVCHVENDFYASYYEMTISLTDNYHYIKINIERMSCCELTMPQPIIDVYCKF